MQNAIEGFESREDLIKPGRKVSKGLAKATAAAQEELVVMAEVGCMADCEGMRRHACDEYVLLGGERGGTPPFACHLIRTCPLETYVRNQTFFWSAGQSSSEYIRFMLPMGQRPFLAVLISCLDHPARIRRR